MSQQIDDTHRQVIPRWRPFRIAAELRLIDPAVSVQDPTTARKLAPFPGELEQLRHDWAQHRSPIYAAELVDLALITGQREIALDAAEFLLSEVASDHSRGMARTLLRPVAAQNSEPPQVSWQTRYKRIAGARRMLHRTPADPLRWVDLAREYVALGQNDPAERALRRGLALAPDDRFVLRAATRFFIHLHQEERAHDLLRRTRGLPEDPWLLAAEIVAAERAGRTSRWIRQGQRIVESGVFAPLHIAELASVLGTLEHEHGKRRMVRRFINRALVDPTENAVAQASWLARHTPSMDLPEDSLEVPRAYEAAAWELTLKGDYNEAKNQAAYWLRDEPFATRPALFGSWLAGAALGDYAAAAEFAEAALIVDPGDPRPIAQLVFCYATLNRVEDAENQLLALAAAVRGRSQLMSVEAFSIYREADYGLIAFRRGELQVGRQHYQVAIERATELGRRKDAALALLYLAREEARVDPTAAARYIDDVRAALQIFPPSTRSVYLKVLDRIEAVAPSDLTGVKVRVD